MAVKDDADFQREAAVCVILTALPEPGTDRQSGTFHFHLFLRKPLQPKGILIWFPLNYMQRHTHL